MAGRRVLRSPRPVYGRPQTPKQRQPVNPVRLKLWLRAGFVAGALLFAWVWFGVHGLEIKGNYALERKTLERQINEHFQHHPLASNLLTIGLSPLEPDLLGREPRLKSVQIARLWPNRLRVTIIERQPGIVWQTAGKNYLVDVDGIAVSQVIQATSLPVVVDRANLPLKVGERVVPAHFVAFCLEVSQSMPRKTSLKPAGLQVPESVSELVVVTDRGFSIKFDTTRNAEEEVGDLINVLATLAALKKTPAEYIDLRIEHKAYYR